VEHEGWFIVGRQLDLPEKIAILSDIVLSLDAAIGRGWGCYSLLRLGGRRLGGSTRRSGG